MPDYQMGRRLTDYMPQQQPQEKDPAQADFVARFMQVFRQLREQQGPQPMFQGQPQNPQVLQGINAQMPMQQQPVMPEMAPGFMGVRG